MTDADLDIFYWHLINQFWAINRVRIILINRLKRLVGKPGIGIEGLMPYFIDTDERTYFHDGSTKFNLKTISR